MNPFGIFPKTTDPCDCGHHHFTDGTPTGKFRFEKRQPPAYVDPEEGLKQPGTEYVVKAKKTFQCQHENCFERKTEWVTTREDLDEKQWLALRATLAGARADV